MKKLFNAVLLLIALPFSLACSSDKNTSLELGTNSAYVIQGQNAEVEINHGSGDYHITTGDKEVVQAAFVRTGKSPGTVVLTGLKPGTTTVTVTDKVTEEEVSLKTYVLRPHLTIRGAISTEAEVIAAQGKEVPDGLEKELEKNDPLGFFFDLNFIRGSDTLFVEISRGSIVSLFPGKYTIKGTQAKPAVEITYDNGTEEIHKEYTLDGTGAGLMISFLRAELPPVTRDSPPVDHLAIMLTEDLTGKVAQEYPEVVSATLDIHCEAATDKWMNTAFITKFY